MGLGKRYVGLASIALSALLVTAGLASPRDVHKKTARQTVDRSSRTSAKKDSPVSEPREVKLFEAMDRREIEVFVVARNFSLLTLSVRNKTAEPLLILAPKVFAAIPARRVAANQMARMRGRATANQPRGPRPGYGYGYASARGRHSPQGGDSQGLGGAFYHPQPIKVANKRMSPDQGGSMADQKPATNDDDFPWLLLQPGKVITQPTPCFCLEFGKPDPSRRIPYVLRPLKELNPDPTVRELLLLFGQKRVPQRIAQIALWNVANHVPWPLLAKVELPRTMAGTRRKFTLQELQAARTLIHSLPSYRNRMPGGVNQR